jgi:hypothetical protein
MVMAGTKTQTRRIADLERLSVDVPAELRSDLWDIMPASYRMVARKGRHRAKLNSQGAVSAHLDVGVVFGLKPGEFHFRCPLVDGTTHLADHGKDRKIWTVTPVGEQRLWVRETHAQFAVGNRTSMSPQCVAYRATCDEDGSFDYVNNGDEVMRIRVTKWTPSIFMPRWASRTNLTPIQARLMRLQDITDEDAEAEGVTFTQHGPGGLGFPGWHYGPSTTEHRCLYTPRMAFGNYWNRLHGGPNWFSFPKGPSPWDQNPWAYSFRKEA